MDTAKMNPEFKKQWVEALRSGKYRQTNGVLKTGNEHNCRHCCLGVLCDIATTNGVGEWVDTHMYSFAFKIWNTDGDVYDQNGHLLSQPVLKAAGLTDAQQLKLSDLNDHQGWDFNQIAAWIEENL